MMIIWRSMRRVIGAVGWIMVLTGIGYLGLHAYVSFAEETSPSTQQVLAFEDGRQIPLVQPMTASARPARTSGLAPDRAALGVPLQASPVLPPLRVVIPSIEVDWPVVLGDNEHLPQFKGVGWFLGSGFPGAPGNMVLFGHAGGANGTFMRLNELKTGDAFSVVTEAGEQQYRVRTSYETAPGDIAVLAPTSTATATLITCTGPWDPAAQTNERRLIVLADLVEPQ